MENRKVINFNWNSDSGILNLVASFINENISRREEEFNLNIYIEDDKYFIMVLNDVKYLIASMGTTSVFGTATEQCPKQFVSRKGKYVFYNIDEDKEEEISRWTVWGSSTDKYINVIEEYKRKAK